MNSRRTMQWDVGLRARPIMSRLIKCGNQVLNQKPDLTARQARTSPREFHDHERPRKIQRRDGVSSIAREWDLECLVIDDRTQPMTSSRNGCAIATSRSCFQFSKVGTVNHSNRFSSIFAIPVYAYVRTSSMTDRLISICRCELFLSLCYWLLVAMCCEKVRISSNTQSIGHFVNYGCLCKFIFL